MGDREYYWVRLEPLGDPVGDKRSLANAAPGNELVMVEMLLIPRGIESLKPFLATE